MKTNSIHLVEPNIASAEVLAITRTINFEEVQWIRVLDLLIRRGKLSFRQASSLRRNFFSKFLRPFNLQWFLNPRLSANDNSVVSAICDSHSADKVTLWFDKLVKVGPLRLEYHQEVTFEPGPELPKDSESFGHCIPQIQLRLFGMRLQLKSSLQVLSIHLLISIVALLLFCLAAALMVYSLAVFREFLRSPADITGQATRDLRVGLALICFLVGAAGICGRAISNLYTQAIQAIRLWRKLPAKPKS